MKDEINYSISDYEGLKVIKLEGNISNSTRIDFEKLINDITQKSNVILNMNDVGVITSGGFHSLAGISAEARKRNKRVMIMGLREGLANMMETMGVIHYFTFVGSVEEALSRI